MEKRLVLLAGGVQVLNQSKQAEAIEVS